MERKSPYVSDLSELKMSNEIRFDLRSVHMIQFFEPIITEFEEVNDAS